jgi:glycosyltransferase involved in cell wall biosynthesis
MPSAGFDACLLIFLPKPAKNRSGGAQADVEARPDAEAEQTLAIAAALHQAGGTKPLLLCETDGWTHQEARRLNLPCLATKSRYNPLCLIKLWLWQRRQGRLLIQTVGEGSPALGRLVKSWRKQNAVLAHAFFVCPPSAPDHQNKALWTGRKIFCGSQHIRRCLAEAEPGDVKDRLVLLPPGIETDRYIPAGKPAAQDKYASAPAPGAAGARHFIFGMNCGLDVRSGALVVVRAMAAMWQGEGLPPWEVRILGSGRRFAEVFAEAEQLGVTSRLCLLGDQTAPDFLAACHAWLAPGTSAEERPEALWAGFVAGLPVICSKSALHQERLVERDAAVMVKPNNPQALAGAMIALMTDAALRQSLIERAATLPERWELRRMAAEALRCFSVWERITHEMHNM